MTSPRDILVKHLATFLGSDDGAADILDGVISMDSKAEILEYLTQLLGQDKKDLLSFVDDIIRFQNGEPLLALFLQQDADDVKKPAAVERTYLPTKKPQQNRNQVRTIGKAGGRVVGGGRGSNPRIKQQLTTPVTAAATTSKKTFNDETAKLTGNMTPTVDKTTTAVALLPQEAPRATVVKPIRKSLPQQGKALIQCGCFGTVHAPLTNCLHCGRISCQREGYDFCNFCGWLVEPVELDVNTNGLSTTEDKARQHMDQLLRFQSEGASRTVVLDDQADYYSNQPSSWLNEQEQADAAEREALRNKDVHERKKQQLDLMF